MSVFQKLRQRRGELRMALVFLGLILVPSGLLAYLSWRALENEKALSRERLQESYRQLATLAARNFDEELRALERQWSETLKEIIKRKDRAAFARFEESDSLVAALFILPPKEEAAAKPRSPEKSFLREHRVFDSLVETGDELEYNAGDFAGALMTYRKVLDLVAHPQLRGMVECNIGRVQQKLGEWDAALQTFRGVLENYAEVRDLDNTYLRFVARFQIASCEENLGRDREALETLLLLQEELWERSDAISAQQYSYFHEQTQLLAARLVVSPRVAEAGAYQEKFRAWARRAKKRISRQYFAQLVEGEWRKAALEDRRYRARIRFISEVGAEEPFLLAYHFLPDSAGAFIRGVVGFEVDLQKLRARLAPKLTRDLRSGVQAGLSFVNERTPRPELVIAQPLAAPFDFWQIALALEDPTRWERRWDFRTTLGLWLILLLLLSIVLSAVWFIRRAAHEAYLSRMKSNFVSNVSHEFRTPLASIKMLAELMEMQLAGPAKLDHVKAQQYLGVIRRESDRLTRLIENVLDFAKIERGMKQYRFEYEEPSAVLLAAIEAFRPHAEAQGFRLETEIAPDMPEMRMDADAMTQALLNLLGNAVKYSEAVKEIRVRGYVAEQRLLVEVTDHGLGIAPEELPKIFNDFYRVDQRLSTNQQGGMGLGLTLARHIVRAHRGEITVRSVIGEGSTFTMNLPLLQTESETFSDRSEIATTT